MKRRHQRRTTLIALAGVAVASGLLSTVAAAPASAAVRIAGTGYVVTENGTRLNTRSGPAAGSARTGSAAPGTALLIVCQVTGQHITGTVRSTAVWDRLHTGSYVSDAYVTRRSFPIPTCGATTPAPAPSTPTAGGAWTLPVTAGLVSAFRTSSRPTHDGVDLGAARNTPIRAAAVGTVIRVVCNASTDNCDVDGSRSISGCGWYAEILHPGNIVTRYCHMVKRPSVAVGQSVARGQVIGYVGTSGASSGPHLHFEVHMNAPPANRSNAVDPVNFMRVKGLVIS